MEWIIKYAVVRVDSNPMYGRNRTLDVFDDKETAIEVAKLAASDREDVCVEKRRYACEENLKKGFTFDQSICWASWM